MEALVQTEVIREQYLHVLERIERAARLVGREGNQIRLVVVTKSQPMEKIEAVIQAGATDLGENYVEEAMVKMERLRGKGEVIWHMIGHIQSRKARPVCEHFDWVHSLDSLKLATRLERFAGEAGRKLPVLIECNVSGEASKYGFSAWDENGWGNLLPVVNELLRLPHLDIRGLMTMAPYASEPESARPYFRRLRRLRDYLVKNIPTFQGWELSMGMSMDFEVAIQEGATIVRIGEAILGKRQD